MKKKIWIGLFGLLLVMLLPSLTVQAETSGLIVSERYQIGENAWCYLKQDNLFSSKLTIYIEGKGATYDYETDGYDVTRKIKKPDILSNYTIRNLYVADGITVLGKNLLYIGGVARVVHLSNTLQCIKSGNFQLREIPYELIPHSLQNWEYHSSLRVIFSDDEITTLPTKTITSGFYTGENITHITVNNKTQRIESGAFNKLVNLQICEIPSSVTYMGKNVFWRNTDSLVIKGYTNSYAEHYAKINNIKFEPIGKIDPYPLIGEIYTVGKLKYLVKSDNSMAVIGVADKYKNSKSISIPSKVTMYSKSYNVKSIEDKAFFKNKYITTATLGSNIKSIGSCAFCRCDNLRTIKINSTKVSSIKTLAFYANTKNNLKIYLPKQQYSKYRKMIIKSMNYNGVTYLKF